MNRTIIVVLVVGVVVGVVGVVVVVVVVIIIIIIIIIIMRLGLDICIPHQWHCGSAVDARGLRSFVGRKAPGRSARQLLLLLQHLGVH